MHVLSPRKVFFAQVFKRASGYDAERTFYGLKVVMEKKKMIIDTDIGDEIDDAMALYFAMSEGFEIIGITTVFKNTDERARIAKRLLKLYGHGYENIPVFAGHGTPIAEEECEYPHTCHFHAELESDEYSPDGGKDAAVDFLIESLPLLKHYSLNFGFTVRFASSFFGDLVL